MNWEKLEIADEKGDLVFAKMPVIVSASRSTDILTFYADWFIETWKAGYVKWKNLFNGNSLYISFKKTRAVVFWTKNSKPMFKHLNFLDEHIKNYYFQFTLNDYDQEWFDGKIPKVERKINTFKELSNRIGRNRVFWRFDPLLLTQDIDVKELLRRIENIGNQLYTYTNKFLFSFADISIYRKVENNLRKENIRYIEFSQGLGKINEKLNLELATCAEKFDLNNCDIMHNKCIDDDLMIKLFPHDKELMKFLGIEFTEPTLFEPGGEIKKTKKMKDKDQRGACGCIISKDIGEYNTCPHECVYGYANTSK